MGYLSIVLIGVGLAMDAFVVSVTNGMTIKNLRKGEMIFSSAFFGILQGLMPIIGFFIGNLFMKYIESFQAYVCFGILFLIGAKMIVEGVISLIKKEAAKEKKFSLASTIIEGLATSIDALAVGVSLIGISIWISASIISSITFVLCLLGIILGKKFGKVLNSKSGVTEILGGLILVATGIKFLFI